MKAVIRADASIEIGTGHVMRCLTLAHALKKRGVTVSFITRQHPGNLIAEIKQQGFEVYPLAAKPDDDDQAPGAKTNDYASWLGATQTQDADASQAIINKLQPTWVIVDHYALDRTWHDKIKPACEAVLVIDDLADRHYHCDVLVDQNAGATPMQYARRVPADCQILTGPRFTLLRPEFKTLRSAAIARRQTTTKVARLMINMGGVDKDNITGQILEKLTQCSLDSLQEIIVVMGPHAPHLAAVQDVAQTSQVTCRVLTNVSNMGELMCEVDLAIGASGATTWERCCLGLPTIQVVIAQNQKNLAQALAAKHVVKLAGNPAEVSEYLRTANTWFKAYSHNALQVTDGEGADRVVNAMLGTPV